MIIVKTDPYNGKLPEAYYQKALQENIDYLDKHGEGPYSYNGRFSQRVRPYLDAGYWMEYEKWVYKEHNAIITKEGFGFETEEEAMWFALQWI